MKTISFVTACMTVLPFWAEAADPKCSFLSADDGPPFSFELPSMALSHPLSNLPIEFRGVSPIVTRGQLKHGEMPKVTIQRYSTRPDVFYDEVENRVIVASNGCGELDGTDTTVSRSTNSDGGSTSNTLPDSQNTGASVSGAFAAIRKPGLFTWAGTALAFGFSRKPLLASAFVAVGLANTAQAQEEACEPVVQVLVQAPAAYKGAAEVCWEEINDPAICPDPFPTYPTCNDPSPTCEVAVVGAGAGGLYTALR